MSKYTFLGLAAILTAAGSAAKAYAEGAEAPAEATGDTAEPNKPRRGRPSGAGAAASEPAAGATGPTDGERFEKNRELIKPLVEGGQGEEVKKVIAKYSKTGLKDIPATSQADFAKDIEALSY